MGNNLYLRHLRGLNCIIRKSCNGCKMKEDGCFVSNSLQAKKYLANKAIISADIKNIGVLYALNVTYLLSEEEVKKIREITGNNSDFIGK